MQEHPQGIPFIKDNPTQSVQQVFDGAILRLYYNQIQLPNGQWVERELIHHLPAVCILADNDQGQVVLVKQFRPAVAQMIYEVPAGIIDINGDQLEDPLKAAQRELNEETGYCSDNWSSGPSLYVSPGYLDEEICFFRAKGIRKVDQQLAQDENEDVSCHLFTEAEIQDLIQQGQINDLKTLYALQIWLAERRAEDGIF